MCCKQIFEEFEILGEKLGLRIIKGKGDFNGGNCIINNKVLIEHDSSIGDHCHIATAAIINGDDIMSTLNSLNDEANSILADAIEN